MDFTMNMMESSRGISVSQSPGMGGTVAAYQAHQAHQAASAHSVSVPNQQQQQQQSHHQQAAAVAAAVAAAAAAAASQQQQHSNRSSIHEDAGGVSLASEGKLQEMTKDDSEGAFTPPPRVSSVDTRAEKGTDTTTDFEPVIKIEIRGGLPGLNIGSDKDKNNTILLHFNSPSEVLHYFSQRTVPQLDAFNFLANPELVRNINPELVRNHFLYVPSSQETVRVSSNGFSGTSSVAQTSVQGGSPIIVTGPNGGTKTVKQERRRGEVPPGTIIHRNVQLEALPNQFVCWICGLDLQKSLPFEEHMVDQHNVDKPYKCDDCGVTFKRKAHLDRHRRIHLPTRPYQCGVCGKGFTRNEHVRRHAFTHSGEKPYNCPTCGKTFSRREHLSKHLLSHTKAGPHSPTQAGHPQTPGEYEEYMYSPAESPIMQQPPPTQQQQLSLPQQQQQQQMLFSTHETSPSGGGVQGHPGLFHFSQFNSQSSSSNTIGLHMSKQHRQNLQQGLTTTLLLQTTDQNGRIVTINQAGAAVPVSSSSLVGSGGNIAVPTTHSFHTNASGSSSGGGGGHGRQQNGEPVARPYQCGVCGKAFIRNEHLRRHVLTHSGEKPHACSLCGKAFSRREHLSKHLRSHATKGTGPTQQHSPSATVGGHSGLQAGPSTPASIAAPQVSMTTPSVVSSGMQVSTNNPPIAAHSQSITHSMTPSHATPVAHLPPGTHYLPMFSLLAEVV